MAYLAEKQTVQRSERQLITIEFAPPQDPNETEYNYQQPLFVFGDQVTKQHNSSTPLTVCGMECNRSLPPVKNEPTAPLS